MPVAQNLVLSTLLLSNLCSGVSQGIPQALIQQAQNSSASPATLALIGAALNALNDGSSLTFTNGAISAAQCNFSSPWKAAACVPVQKSRWSERLAEAIAAGLSQALLSSDSETVQTGSDLPQDWEALYAEQSRPQTEQQDSIAIEAKAVPGITAVVFSDFFNYASGIAVQLLKENFKKVNLESVTAVAHVPVLGDFIIKLENVRLEGLELDQTTTGVSLADDGTFVLLVSGLDAVVDGHFQWRRTKFPFISGGAQAQVTAQGGNVKLRVQVMDDGAGRPTVVGMEAAELSFDSISIFTSGAKLSWLYNAVAALAKTPIQAAITREVAAQVSTTVPEQVNKLLLGIPTTIAVKGLELNTSLATNPSVTADRLIVWDWGRFQNPDANFEECPYIRKAAELQAGPIMPSGGKYMLVANIDESIVNCLTWDLFRKGMLTHFFVGDDVPKRFLYTDTWMLIVPKVYEMCPNCKMALNASVSMAPKTIIDPARGVVTSGEATLSFFLAEDNRPGEPWTPIDHLHSTGGDSRQGTQEESREMAEGGEVAGTNASMKGEEAGRKARLERLNAGKHLFTLALAGELFVQDLRVEHDVPDRPDSWRLALKMKVNQSALAVDVLESDVGEINKARLKFVLSVAAFLVETQVNEGILKDGFPLPDVPHVSVTRANLTVAEYALALGSDVQYAG